MRKPTYVALLLCCLWSIAGALAADDWVTGVGGKPDRSGASTETGPYIGTLLWRAGGNSYFSEQPVMEGGRVFVARANDDYIFAHDIATGAELWRRRLPRNFADSSIQRVSGVRDGQVYATRSGNTNREYMYALDAVDGSILWRSEALTDENGGETLSYSPEGDPIVGNTDSIVRMQRGTGRTVWTTQRYFWASGGAGVAVSGPRIYAWESPDIIHGQILYVTAYDAATGARLYSSANLRGSGTPTVQVGLFASGGRVYAPLFQVLPASDALVAFADTGTSLVEQWRSPLLPNVPFSSFAVGIDGSVYSYSQADEVLRLDPATGAVRNRSMAIPNDSSNFIARLATDAAGRVYLTAGGVSQASIYAFDASLSLLWSSSVPGVTGTGPALGRDGTLVVCGLSADLRAYRQSPYSASTIRVDPRGGSSSNGNAVWEPGETVALEPSWTNLGGTAIIFGTLSPYSLPPGATYTVVDGGASYGSVATGATANCFDRTGNCYTLAVSSPSTRPAQHWDATFLEVVPGNRRLRTLHIGNSFADVPTASPQYKFVETILHNGITAGCTTGNYCPDSNVTRAQMAVFLMRSKHGSTWNPPPARGTVFTDVPANAFAAAWIERMPLEGISTGCGNGAYCPDSNTTRAQMSVFLLRAHDGMSYNPPACTVAPFTDVPCTSPFAPWIAELVRRGVAAGCGNGKYCPDDPVTRGQMAVFLTTTFALQLYAP